ncbi:GNAT family N-acetyltransferase [Flaviflexus equikiangi]|uniref:GNAT family N-acetyltransferase n=1 Tax=Flaviflexus equikiangi TaxID=2758573 RepID=UPI0015F74883|nr:GNAT family protein [Flaviflexus equikiangi]
MTITLTRLDPVGVDYDELVSFMTSNRFPFHVRQTVTREDVETAIADGSYRDDDNDSYWIDHDSLGRIGFLRFEDLTDLAPLFDMRLAQSMRGRGLGAQVLEAATAHAFSLAGVDRFEGQTREDNIAMRRVFARCGWVQEAYYREAWPVEGGKPLASVAYSVLRRDWETGTVTPIVWDL